MKSPVKSKTINLGALVVILGAVQQYLPEVAPMLGEHAGLVNMVIGVAVIYLRFLTTEPVKGGKAP